MTIRAHTYTLEGLYKLSILQWLSSGSMKWYISSKKKWPVVDAYLASVKLATYYISFLTVLILAFSKQYFLYN